MATQVTWKILWIFALVPNASARMPLPRDESEDLEEQRMYCSKRDSELTKMIMNIIFKPSPTSEI